MAAGQEPPVSALQRFKRSVSRISTKRKDVRQRNDNSDGDIEGFKRCDDPVLQRQPRPPPTGHDSWHVDPLLETFSERLQDVLDVHSIVLKARHSVRAASRMTSALKDQSAAALDIAKQDFSFSAKKDSDFSRKQKAGASGSQPNDRHLHLLEGNIICGTLESLATTISSLEEVQGDISASSMSAATSTDEYDQMRFTTMATKLEDLKATLIDTLLAKKEQAVRDSDIHLIARLLGRLTNPRVELQCILEHYSNAIRHKVSSDIVSLSVSSTVHFVQEESSLCTPSRLSSDIGFTMMTMLLDAHDRSEELIEQHSLRYLRSIFNDWAQQQVRESCEVLLRLVILPMAVPKGFLVVSECISLFQKYCMAIESVANIHLENTVASVLRSSFMDICMKTIDQEHVRIRDIASQSRMTDSNYSRIVVEHGVKILECLNSNEYLLGHQRHLFIRQTAEKYVSYYIDALPSASDKGAGSAPNPGPSPEEMRRSMLRSMLGEDD